jgi:hypothetical protein
MTSQYSTISADLTVAQGGAYLIIVDPGTTARNLLLYTPTNNAVVHRHEIINLGTSTGVITVKDPTNTTTYGTVPIGKKGEVMWNPKTAAWQVFPSA